jgi:hypothetical protein
MGILTLLAGCTKPGNYSDEKVAQQVTCVNNLKQIGVAFLLWSGDHGDKHPFAVSTNAGGVMELVTAKDGLRQNGHLIFQDMSNELTVPLILVCPQDKSKFAAKDWASLRDCRKITFTVEE